jgi:GNAT superfamily N-acetyltransferase
MTFFCSDERLKEFLYDLGFGAYVMDAFCIPAEASSFGDIRRAGQNDVDALFGLAQESRLYYRNAPVFLKRDIIGKDKLKQLVEDEAVFIAVADGKAVGFMNISVSRENDPITLAAGWTALIDEIGAYIKPEYRGRGIGDQLLHTIRNHCAGIGVERIHVDFETANPFANRFWRKYFDPMLLSVKRGINRDINDD